MAQHLRIALIAPPWLPVPPPAYGGTEAVVHRLAVGLQELGHEVLLFTTGDSTCPVPKAWVRERADFNLLGQSLVEAQHIVRAYQRVADFDIVHDHTVLGPVLGAERMGGRLVVTNHGPFTPEFSDVLQSITGRAALIAISHDQASHSPVPVDAVIHHGLRPDELPVGRGDGDYLLFLGRFYPEKGAKEAIEIARAAGVPLRMAAKMREPMEIDYFHEVIEPMLGEDAQYLGEISGEEKAELIGSARALLNPIRWPEPFGLVMIEALACGTPVLTRRAGAAPEIVEDGVTGFVCDSDQALVGRVAQIDTLDRAACRAAVDGHFSAARMVDEHVRLYEEVLARSALRRRARLSAPGGASPIPMPVQRVEPDAERPVGPQAVGAD